MWKMFCEAILSLFRFMVEMQDVTAKVGGFFTRQNMNMFLSPSGILLSNQTLSGLNNIILAVAYTILAIGFVLGLYSMASKQDAVQAQGIVIPLKFFFRIMIIKILIESVQEMFLSVVSGFAGAVEEAAKITTADTAFSANSVLAGMLNSNHTIKDEIIDNMASTLKLSSIILVLLFALGAIAMLAISLMIGFYILGIMVDCILYYFAAPIAVASISCEQWANTGFTYLKTILSIGLNILLILVATKISSQLFLNVFNVIESGKGIGNVLFNGLVASPQTFIRVFSSADPAQTMRDLQIGSAFTLSLKVIAGNMLMSLTTLTLFKKSKQVANLATGGAFN
ncbi:MAG: hypothetical protein E6053_07180 [Finegoldia magna]|uniref:type IV secretion system protein n=1 Tax=Finegoldia magna TaxID=1260 RepID=UPI00291329C6|nr:type IV secretion system protein [Finegoldia magna]MDU5527234.1 hypothetical protein [Finegoldia magna]